MSEALLPKLVIYPQEDAEVPCVIYGNRLGLQTLLAAVNNTLVKNPQLNTQSSEPTIVHFEVDGTAYPLHVHLCTDRLFDDVLTAPFFDYEKPEIPKPSHPIPAFVSLKKAILNLTNDDTWQDFFPMTRAHLVVNAYKEHNVQNRLSSEMLMAAMSKMPLWFQTTECYFNMSRALNSVIDLDHPDTLVLRSELDEAKEQIRVLEREIKKLQPETLPF